MQNLLVAFTKAGKFYRRCNDVMEPKYRVLKQLESRIRHPGEWIVGEADLLNMFGSIAVKE